MVLATMLLFWPLC